MSAPENNILKVRGLSMSGVIEPGDEVQVTVTKAIKKKDLVVFCENGLPEEANQKQLQVSIKQCFGTAGDKITMNSETGELWVNGSLCPVKLQNDAQKFCWGDWLKFLKGNVPDGYIFLLGTSDDAQDSRKRGYISLLQCLGVAEKI